MGNWGHGRWNSGQRGGVWDWYAQYATPQGRSDERRETCSRIGKVRTLSAKQQECSGFSDFFHWADRSEDAPCLHFVREVTWRDGIGRSKGWQMWYIQDVVHHSPVDWGGCFLFYVDDIGFERCCAKKQVLRAGWYLRGKAIIWQQRDQLTVSGKAERKGDTGNRMREMMQLFCVTYSYCSCLCEKQIWRAIAVALTKWFPSFYSDTSFN